MLGVVILRALIIHFSLNLATNGDREQALRKPTAHVTKCRDTRLWAHKDNSNYIIE
ncbi:hypothetical protein HOF92_09290 [bacterium]|nr:hypothetical protein [bacterium]